MNEFNWDDDNNEFIYDNVQWYWDETCNKLMCKSFRKVPEVNKQIPVTGNLDTLEFRHDIDVNEQQRFKKKIQRKYGPNDVVTLQDIKDVVLFTAPSKLLMPAIISIIHRSATDRMLRALIMYCQYFLQVAEKIKTRRAVLQYKIRTPKSDIIEAIFKQDLRELRMLITKEYCTFLTGSGEFLKYHHMWSSKFNRAPSLGNKEQTLFENFLQIVIQIIWIALGRISFTQIEIEIHRLFKSNIYNIAEHNHKNDEYWKYMEPSDIVILTGRRVITKKKLNTNSPLITELLCTNDIDHRLFGIGVLKYSRMGSRLEYLEKALTMPEASLGSNDISLGILGVSRDKFDIMLNEIKSPSRVVSTNYLLGRSRSDRRIITNSSNAQLITRQKITTKLYKDIILPEKKSMDLLSDMSYVAMPRKPIDKVQQLKWMRKVLRKNSKFKL